MFICYRKHAWNIIARVQLLLSSDMVSLIFFSPRNFGKATFSRFLTCADVSNWVTKQQRLDIGGTLHICTELETEQIAGGSVSTFFSNGMQFRLHLWLHESAPWLHMFSTRQLWLREKGCWNLKDARVCFVGHQFTAEWSRNFEKWN